MHATKAVRLFVTIAMLAATLVFAAPTRSQVAIGISVGFAPPELPVYEQPICPGEGYLWTPGYWAWDADFDDYYWVPGTWVLAPEPGFLWTPPYWGWNGVAFVFYQGYWGPRVGFYGGIDYGFGYFGHGYEGGRWEGDRFYYNRTVNNINITNIHNVYNTTVINNRTNVTRVSYNGGNGGITARASAQDEAAARERHIAPVAVQQQHFQEARQEHSFHASENRGKPAVAATPRPGAFHGGGVVAAREGGRYNPPPNRGVNNANRPVETNRSENRSDRPRNANRPEETNRPKAGTDRPSSTRTERGAANRPNYVHPNDVPKVNRSDRPPSSGNPKADQKYQRQQDKMYQKQEQEHQKLQQKQDQEHSRAVQRHYNEGQRQQMEQRHQQQTQQMEQRHTQQQQHTEQHAPQPRQQPPHQP